LWILICHLFFSSPFKWHAIATAVGVHKAQTILSIWFYIIFSGFYFCDLIFMFYEEACSWPELDYLSMYLYMHFEYPFDLGQAQFVILCNFSLDVNLRKILEGLLEIDVNMFLVVTYNNSMFILFKTIIAYMIM
ncbi:hypothetical protein ACJX0J_042005, partial [Zea mays]